MERVKRAVPTGSVGSETISNIVNGISDRVQIMVDAVCIHSALLL